MNDRVNPDDNDTQHPLLIEVGVEEIPSNVLPETLRQLSAIASKRFEEAGLPFGTPEVYGTPRRIVLHIPHLAAMQETKTETLVGPPKQAAYDDEGNPTQAAIGFAKSQGVDLSEIQIQDAATLGPAAKGKKGDYLVLKKEKPGEATARLLMILIPEMIARLTFPRSMRWNASGVAFVRPIRSLLAIYDGKVIPFSYAGVSTGDQSHGHRIMAPESFPVKDFESYREGLRKRFVLIDPKERMRLIQSEVQALAKEKQGRVGGDEGLLAQAADTVEYPKAVCGNFDADFLDIPKEMITTAMAEHQGYFPLYNKDGGLLPHFITISNVDAKEMTLIQKGNERVLRARLVDARFYFDQDRKQSLSDFVAALERVTFQEKLGSLQEKTVRLCALSVFIAKEMGCTQDEILGAQGAALLSKADLLTGVVREFPSLQGTMGRIYAALDGESAAISNAIEEHYLPRYSGGPLPATRHGRILALADKIDTLVGCFGVGLIPSGSEDPYALRRQGLGLIQILLSETVFRSLSITKVLDEALGQYAAQEKFSGKTSAQALTQFLRQRIDAYLQSEGVRYDLREALLCVEIDRPADIVERAEALVQFSKAPLFSPLMTAFKRAIRILPEGFNGAVEASMLNEGAEKNLHSAIVSIEKGIRPLWPERHYFEILESLAALFQPLNRFFDAVMVMDPNEAIRHNRLSLLFKVKNMFAPFADFSKIVEDDTRV